MTKIQQMKTNREFLRPVSYPINMGTYKEPKVFLVEGFFHQWIAVEEGELHAIVENPDGQILLVDYDEITFTD